MQQTEKYQFNLIETSDPFSPEPLNQNMEKAEAALEAQQAEVDALPRIHLMSYTGNGQNKRTFTFPFKPGVVFFTCLFNTNSAAQMLVQGQEVAVTSNGASEALKFYVSWAENSVTLRMARSDYDGYSMFNGQDCKYAAMAIRFA